MAAQAHPMPFYRYSGRIRDDDPRHAPVPVEAEEHAEAQEHGGIAPERPPRARRITAPDRVIVGGIIIPKWGKTVQGLVQGYKPATDCDGNFMPFKNQPNNNCYNYACNVATNTFAQPGRKHEVSVVNDDDQVEIDKVIAGAKADGLVMISEDSLSMKELARHAPKATPGHFVALLFAHPVEAAKYGGDFHWVRCDSSDCTVWSQKNGPQQVVNLDFTGQPIADPRTAGWGCNVGLREDGSELFVPYHFKAWMYVPFEKVDIV